MLTLHIEGLPEDRGDVRLAVMVDKLDAFKSALIEAGKLASNADKSSVDFVITKLEHKSPAAITVDEVPMHDRVSATGRSIGIFLDAVKAVTVASKKPIDASYALLECIHDITKGIGEKLTRVWFSVNDEVSAVVNDDTTRNLVELLRGKVQSYGSVKGVVERYNSHGQQKYFHIYPPIGGRVRCSFTEEHRQKASLAVDKNVIVRGLLKYRAGEFAPSEISVDSIEILPSDDQLPMLSALSGVAPNATGDQTSVDFVRKLRDDWH